MKESVLSNKKECYICHSGNILERHHIFYNTSNRKISEKYGMVVYLCYDHHRRQPTGVHGGNRELDLVLKKQGQEIYEKQIGTREEFIRDFGRNYL